MPIVVDDAIVLARYPFRERSSVGVFLTKKAGVLRGVVRGLRSRNPAFGVLEPLAQVRLTMFVSPRTDLATVDEVVLCQSWLDLAQKPLSWAAAQVAAELALEFCPAGTPQEGFYRLLAKMPLWLLQGADPELAVHYLQLWATKLAGVLPDITTCALCHSPISRATLRYLPGTGFTCDRHQEGLSLSSTSLLFLQEALHLPLDKLTTSPGKDLAQVLNTMIRQYLEKDLRTLAIFRTLREKMQQGG